MKAIQLPPGNTPIWQLTVDQFKELLQSSQPEKSVNEDNNQMPPKRYVHGVSGIRSLFNCSYPTAHKLKETIIKPAVSQQGKVIIVDAELAIKLFQEHEQVKSVKDLKTNKSDGKTNTK